MSSTGAARRPRIVRREADAAAALPGDLHPVTRRVLAARGVTSAAALDTSLKDLLPADGLGDIERAAELLAAHLAADQRILVVGDFDADGATSTALAVRALRAFGARDVGFLVPNRFEYGYGLTPEIVALAGRERPRLIVTVDNGMSSVDGVAAARAAGIEVLITDHHLPGATLPAAAAIVNPNLPGARFPSKHLAGVGVIFYVMSALRARLRERGWFAARDIAEPNLASLLDLVALGTVADVVPLDHNNRRLVAQGLARIRAGHCQPGITALIDAAGRVRERLTTSDLGFAIGPRLNAAGRLADMALGIECLLADEPARCAAMAAELDRLNRERRDIEEAMRDQAFAQLTERLRDTHGDALPSAIAIVDDDWHQGVIGIVAARIRERYHRPVIAFAPADEEFLKGSGRSIPGLHLRDALDAVATAHPGLLSRFGGHAMAAGLTLARRDFGAFSAAFAEVVAARVDADTLEARVLSDGELRSEEFCLELARELRRVAPWGQGFPEPRFDGLFRIDERRIVGGSHARLKLTPEQGAPAMAAIAFGAAGADWFAAAARIRAVFKLDVNDYRGTESLQLVIDHAEAA